MLWARGFIREVVEKQGKPANQACSEINLEVSFSAGKLYLINKGNIPIDYVEITTKESGEINKLELDKQWTLGTGQSDSVDINGNPEEIKVIPAIRGIANNQQKIYTCLDYPIIVNA